MIQPLPEPLSASLVRPWLPSVATDRNKYSAGQVLLLGGCDGMEGAAWLAAEGAYRSGAGIVRWLRDHFAPTPATLPELVQMEMSKGPGEALQELRRTGSLLIGVGCRDRVPPSWMVELVQAAQEQRIPVLFDGGAFHWIREGLVAPTGLDCLTPHAGELAHLIPLAHRDRQKAAREAAERWGCCVVAKGPMTWIMQAGGPTWVSHEADPGMATAGMGDGLAGLITGFCAQGMTMGHAAGLAVWLHSRAGRMAAALTGSLSLLASDLLKQIPSALCALSADKAID